ncbi:hypothetical protein KKC13_00865 [bacterium]|nr:hypothetical protein [bacterium]MBU1958946.1 hypothetical protein [bacterium]
MARPTKEEIARREQIKSLGLFVRDSHIYTAFEEETQKANLTPTKLSYLFCNECEKRNQDYGEIYARENIRFLKYDKNVPIIKPLLKINLDLGAYLFYLYYHKFVDYSNDKVFFPPYSSSTLAYKKDIEKALGRCLNTDLSKSMIEFSSQYPSTSMSKMEFKDWMEYYNTDDELVNISFLRDDFFTKEDKIKIQEHYKTINYRDYHNLNYLTLITKDDKCEYGISGLERNTFAEIDLTKPLEEIVEFVTMLKNDYDQDPTCISNFHRLIGMELEDHQCSLEACDIYKHKNPKTLSGRLMDVLFIYDCKVAELDDSYIMSEIDRYWNDVKNVHKEKITKNTFQKYRKLAIDYIDNLEYKNFIKGYDLPLD